MQGRKSILYKPKLEKKKSTHDIRQCRGDSERGSECTNMEACGSGCPLDGLERFNVLRFAAHAEKITNRSTDPDN